jgi:hypothetical protein
MPDNGSRTNGTMPTVSESCLEIARCLPELCVNLGDELSGQAAAFSQPASMPSVNLTPVISFGN